MSTSCVVCKGTSQCQRCQIKDLKLKIEQQEYALQYFQKDSNQQLRLPKDYAHYFERDNKFLPIKYYGEMVDYHFLTITFDPNKFGIFNQHVDEQNYIFKYLHKSIDKQIVVQLTGCFEYQKNGTTHAHIILKSAQRDSEIEDFFRNYFTNDPKNKYAIKSYKLQKEKCETYLQKESTEYFRYDLTFDDDLMEQANPFADCKSKCVATVNDILNIIRHHEEIHKQEQLKLATRLIKKYGITTTAKELLYAPAQK